jgi:DNA-binding transcriptional MerR regulator
VTAAGKPARDGLSIGAVLERLRLQFPDVTISKIRFLESEGLVCPARTRSGYRQFTESDVERLRFVLSAQRDHYLPLKVIKEQLDAADASRSGPQDRADQDGPAAARAPRGLVSVPVEHGLPTAASFAKPAEIRMTREELLARSGVDAGTLAELEQYGLIRPGAAGFYDSLAVSVARTVAALAQYGIEPRHLRAFRASADREVGLLEQIVAPMYRHPDPGSRARADEAVLELAALSVSLHTLLVKAGLRGVAGR